MVENYYLLFTAIILQAERDYYSKDDKTRTDAIQFIRSDDFYYFTGVEGEIILTKLQSGAIRRPRDVLDKAYWNSDPDTIQARINVRNNRTEQKAVETDTQDSESNRTDP